VRLHAALLARLGVRVGAGSPGPAARGPARLLGQPVSPRWPLGGFLPEVSCCQDEGQVFSGENFSVLSGACSSGNVHCCGQGGGRTARARASSRPPPSPPGAVSLGGCVAPSGGLGDPSGPLRPESATAPPAHQENGSRALRRPAPPSSTLRAWGCGAES
jgi:hypothetical protein